MAQSSTVFLPAPLRQPTHDVSDLVRDLPRLLGAEPNNQAVFFHFTPTLGGQALHSLTVIDLESFLPVADPVLNPELFVTLRDPEVPLRIPNGEDRHNTYTRTAILAELSSVFAHTKTHTIAVLIGIRNNTSEQNMAMLNRAAATVLTLHTVTDAYLLDRFTDGSPILRFIPDGNVATTNADTGETETVVISSHSMSTRIGDLFAHNLDEAQDVRYRIFSEELDCRVMDFIAASDASDEGGDDPRAFAEMGNNTLMEITDIFAYYTGSNSTATTRTRAPLRDELVCLATLCPGSTLPADYRSDATILRDAMFGVAAHYPEGAKHVARNLITIAVDPRIKATALCVAIIGELSQELNQVSTMKRNRVTFDDLDAGTQYRINDMIHAAIMADPDMNVVITMRRHLDAGKPIASLMKAITTGADLARHHLTTEA